LVKPPVELIDSRYRADETALTTPCALTRVYVPGTVYQGHVKSSNFPFHPFHFSIRNDVDILVTADLDQFRGDYSHGAVIGRKGFIQLRHEAAYG
jgi:hypothetical protein